MVPAEIIPTLGAAEIKVLTVEPEVMSVLFREIYLTIGVLDHQVINPVPASLKNPGSG